MNLVRLLRMAESERFSFYHDGLPQGTQLTFEFFN
jgi:hypothetical protein